MEELEDMDIFDEKRDVILYDVLGDVVCGGFSVPMREKYADTIYIVTSSEFMSIYAANNIMKSIKHFSSTKSIQFGGLIFNERSKNLNYEILNLFAEMSGTEIIGRIPYDRDIMKAELQAKTLAELYPDSKAYNAFKNLGKKILENKTSSIPEPLSEEKLEFLANKLLTIEEKGE